MKPITKWIATAALLGVSTSSFAAVDDFLVFRGPPPGMGGGDNHFTATPEIDPASTASALTLLMGGVLVLRGRRRAH